MIFIMMIIASYTDDDDFHHDDDRHHDHDHHDDDGHDANKGLSQVVGVDYCAAAIKLAKQVKFCPNTKYILAHCNQAVPQIKASHPNLYSQVAEQADLDLDFEV